jgi:hypothetical protein
MTKAEKYSLALKVAMIEEIRSLLGSGYVPDYYEQLAAGFVRIAENYATQIARKK